MNNETRPIASWRSPKTSIRESRTQGKGVFADEVIETGELVAVKGGHLITGQELASLQSIVGEAELQIAPDLFLAPLTPKEHDPVMMFLNHNCEPNAGVSGNILFVAMRPIQQDEEVTIDYAMIDDGDFSMACTCQAITCRGTIHGKDWQKPALQKKYAGFFSSYLSSRFSEDPS